MTQWLLLLFILFGQMDFWNIVLVGLHGPRKSSFMIYLVALSAVLNVISHVVP
jgi:hypothetical protein